MSDKKCFFCGNEYTPKQQKEKMPPQLVKHTHNGQILEDMAIVYNDAFFEIVSGKYKGNLIHRWNVLK